MQPTHFGGHLSSAGRLAWWPVYSAARAGGDIDEAEAACKRGIELGDRDADYVLASLQLSSRDSPRDAIRTLRAGCEREDLPSLKLAASAYRTLDGDASKPAAELLEQAHRVGDAAAGHELGHVRAALGDASGADAAFATALEGGNLPAAGCLIEHRLKQGDVPRAWEAAELGDRFGAGHARVWLVEQLFAKGDDARAIEVSDRIAKSDDADANWNAGMLLFDQSEFDRAVALLLHADELGEPRATCTLSQYWHLAGEAELSKAARDRARGLGHFCHLDPEHPEHDASMKSLEPLDPTRDEGD
jgi:hypothetical protein